ncbi:MAG: alpha/beta hydrolase [Chloroflexi bacterium]|nr:alpha/beta hydrolase [Chloroflexota bacterium]MCC6892189.1 lysophospholipase [Anaerolineae bacterium]
MKHTTGSFKSVDGTTIYTESWLSDADPRAVVIIVHGVGEHIGRYQHVAPKFVEAGYAVYGLDHHGHGKSGGDTRTYFDAFDQPINDLKQYVDTVKAAHPGKKLFIYGHSLGSLITLVFALRCQQLLSGLILSGVPLAVESSQPTLLIAVAGLLNRIAPKFGATPPVPSSTLSRDEAVTRAYDTDPLVEHGNMRVRTSYLIVTNSREVVARAGELKLPVFIFHGSADTLCPPAGSQTLYDRIGSTDKTLKFYEGLLHETHNEPEKEMVINNIIQWLNAH